MVNAGREAGAGDGQAGAGKHKGSLGSPQVRSCFVLVVLTGLLFLSVARPGLARSGVVPSWDSRTNGLLWTLMLPRPLRVQPVLGAASGQFYCSRSGRGRTRLGASSPKESVCYVSTLLFLLCRSRFVLFLLCWIGVFVFVVRILMQVPCQFLKTLINQRVVIFKGGWQAEKSRVPVTGGPGCCYTGWGG